MGQGEAETTPVGGNQLVAYNLRRARELRGWTQEEAAERLEPFLGVRWDGPTFSVAERWRPKKGQKARKFDPDDIIAFAKAFRVPVTWFLLPPEPQDGLRFVQAPGQAGRGEGVSPGAMVELVLGTEEGWTLIEGRLTDLFKVLPSKLASDLQRRVAMYAFTEAAAVLHGSSAALSETEAHLREAADLLANARRASMGRIIRESFGDEFQAEVEKLAGDRQALKELEERVLRREPSPGEQPATAEPTEGTEMEKAKPKRSGRKER
jgi:transcriptional regulator with XRE-family HTH domain